MEQVMKKVFYRKYPGLNAGRKKFYGIRGYDSHKKARQEVSRRVAACAFVVSEMACEMVRSIAGCTSSGKEASDAETYDRE